MLKSYQRQARSYKALPGDAQCITTISLRSRNELQGKLDLPWLKVGIRSRKHSRSSGEAVAAQNLHLQQGHVQLVIEIAARDRRNLSCPVT